MKKIGVSLVIFGILSSIAFAKDEKSSAAAKIGERADNDAPCTCVFDKTRTWVPEKIFWKNKAWKCAKYDSDGRYCVSVEQIPEGTTAE